MKSPGFFVVGAGSRLGRLVIAELLETMPGSQLAALVPYRAQADKLRALGVDALVGNYAASDVLARALRGVGRLLLIASTDIGERPAHHRAVIDAACDARVGTVFYTSILHADSSPLALAADHRRTEAYLRESRVPFVLLRNGWFTENDMAAIPPALERGTLLGSSGEGRFAWAELRDYAAAAAAALAAREDLAGHVYELAGDEAFTRSELAAEVSSQAGKPLAYRNLARAQFQAELMRAGLPEETAAMLADSDEGASQGALYDDGRQLSRLIGRPTTPLATSVSRMLA